MTSPQSKQTELGFVDKVWITLYTLTIGFLMFMVFLWLPSKILLWMIS